MTDSNSQNTSYNSTLDENTSDNNVAIHHRLDTQGLICPEPVMMLHRTVRRAESGELIEVIATDPATTRDIPNFCRHLGHTLIKQTQSDLDRQVDDNTQGGDTIYRYVIQKK